MAVVSLHLPLVGVSSSQTALNRAQGIQHEVAKLVRWTVGGELAVQTRCGRWIDMIVHDVTGQELIGCLQCANSKRGAAVIVLLHPDGWVTRVTELAAYKLARARNEKAQRPDWWPESQWERERRLKREAKEAAKLEAVPAMHDPSAPEQLSLPS